MTFRHVLTLFAATAVLWPTVATADCTVNVTVVGIKASQGYLMVALHEEKGWSGPPVARLKIPVAGATMTITLRAPTPGRYGVKMYHDINADGVMSTNIVGFPTEPVGFSNDAPIRFGPPSFSDAGFEIGPNGARQTITLR